MIVLDTLLIGGIKFVLRRIVEAVDAQLNDVDTLRQELLAAQMRVELGEMTDAEFAEVEEALLVRMREIQERAREEGAGAMRRVPRGRMSKDLWLRSSAQQKVLMRLS